MGGKMSQPSTFEYRIDPLANKYYAKHHPFLSICIFQETIPVPEVFQQLKCSAEGLSSAEGENRLQIFGPNKLEEKKVYIIS